MLVVTENSSALCMFCPVVVWAAGGGAPVWSVELGEGEGALHWTPHKYWWEREGTRKNQLPPSSPGHCEGIREVKTPPTLVAQRCGDWGVVKNLTAVYR